jgi:imidazoleglycerol-phosphate dehydratase
MEVKMGRFAEIKRKTGETDIVLSIELDGKGNTEIETGVGFFDHMLNLFSKHGLFNTNIKAIGDLHVDSHHTIEDVGIALGQAIKEALGDKKSIKRYGTMFLPMDESLAMVSIDLSGRPYLVFDAKFTQDSVGSMDTELVEEFFRAVAFNAGMNLHIKVLYGSNNHHMIEAIFKAFGRALDEATRLDERIEGVMSTKGSLN